MLWFRAYVPQTSALQQYSGYKASDLRECVLAIHDLQLAKRGSSSRAIREKYTQQKVHQSCTLHKDLTSVPIPPL